MNDVPTPAPTTIRNLRIGIVAATLLTGLLVLYVVNYYPRTDTGRCLRQLHRHRAAG